MTFKKITGKIHLWLGFTAGLVVIISYLPAALFVWDEELTQWYYQDYVYVQPREGQTTLPVSILLKNAQEAVPGKEVGSVYLKDRADKAYVFSTWKEAENPGWTWFSEYEYWDEIYVNPYTGEVTGVVDKRYDWITMSRYLHQNLLLQYDIGHWFVAIATLIMFVMGITGLILWWPRNKAILKQRFSIKWDARWRRVNYDIHNVGGFYTYLFIVLLAATGLVWSFDWWTNGIYYLLGDDPETVFARHEPPPMTDLHQPKAIDIAFADAHSRVENWEEIYFDFPWAYGGDGSEMSAFVQYHTGTSGWEESDSYYYKGATGELFHTKTHRDKSIGEKWRNSNYAIHVGSIYGLPTKILATFIALFSSSLPVTGFYIWWGRKKKKIKRTEKTRTFIKRKVTIPG